MKCGKSYFHEMLLFNFSCLKPSTKHEPFFNFPVDHITLPPPPQTKWIGNGKCYGSIHGREFFKRFWGWFFGNLCLHSFSCLPLTVFYKNVINLYQVLPWCASSRYGRAANDLVSPWVTNSQAQFNSVSKPVTSF